MTIRLLRRLKVLLAITAAYLVLGLAGVSAAIWVATAQIPPASLPVWVAAELVTLFLYTLISLLERLFTAALEKRARGHHHGQPQQPQDRQGPRDPLHHARGHLRSPGLPTRRPY